MQVYGQSCVELSRVLQRPFDTEGDGGVPSTVSKHCRPQDDANALLEAASSFLFNAERDHRGRYNRYMNRLHQLSVPRSYARKTIAELMDAASRRTDQARAKLVAINCCLSLRMQTCRSFVLGERSVHRTLHTTTTRWLSLSVEDLRIDSENGRRYSTSKPYERRTPRYKASYSSH